MGHDGVNGSAKRKILPGNRLVDCIEVGAVGQSDLTTMGVADEFAQDAIEDAFLVGHESGHQGGQVAHLTAVG